MGDSTLLVRHLPSSLTKEEKEDFLRHFGAVHVRVMGNKGPLKHTAFAEFPNKDVASQVLGKLHQVEVLGCRLVVEFALSHHDRHLPHHTDRPPDRIKKEGEEERKKEEDKEEEDSEENAFDFSFLQWGLKYPRRRRLYYLYPPPSPSILTNISHALAACPKLYVQVLHLMNKMDLPAPFGPVTAQPPLAPDMGVMEDYADKLQMEEMELSSTEESELESDPDTSKPPEETPRKRKPGGESRKQMKKRARLAMSMFQAAPPPPDARPCAPAVPLEEVFEQAAEGGGQRKIQLRLPSSMTLESSASSPSVVRGGGGGGGGGGGDGGKVEGKKGGGGGGASPMPPPPLPPLAHIAGQSSGEVTEAMETDTPQSTGFGVLTPASKAADDSEEKDEEEEAWAETKFISRSELRKGRLSRQEMENFNIFRNYKEGEPSRRLYIKNLAKHVTEEDLHWVFGRYVNWNNDLEKSIFDIRLMKEGRMKGQAFVTLGTDEQAAKAVRDTNAFVLKGKPMVVHFARSAKQQDESKS
ncbi:RNA-binding region-containing protein 3-like [Babylonia areolata]|uniref:RNA-binding region-containing protein 3-like n=1 Tax=Babylonia areolata TaxID=304850 RepID=UPI003FD331B7